MKLPELTCAESRRIAESAESHINAAIAIMEAGKGCDLAAVGILLRRASDALHQGLCIPHTVLDRDTTLNFDNIAQNVVLAGGRIGAVHKLVVKSEKGEMPSLDPDLLTEYLVDSMFQIDQTICHENFRNSSAITGVYHAPYSD